MSNRPAFRRPAAPETVARPGVAVRIVAWLMTTWCFGFAAVNVVWVATDHFAGGPYADYSTGLAVMSLLVVSLKVLGAAVALLSVRRLPRWAPPDLVAVLVWGAALLLGVYTLGAVVEAIGMLTGTVGSSDDITGRSLAYLVFFALGATGYAVLAGSFSRRYGVRRRAVVVGALGAPLLLALVLLAVPAVLTALGMMPD